MAFLKFSAGLAVTVAVTFAATAAQADFRVCNKTDDKLNASVGYKHDDYGWTSEGWWSVNPGECTRILNGHLSQRYIYVYAMSDHGVWEAQKEEQDGGYFCISKTKFTFHNKDFQSKKVIDCEAGGQVTKHFLEVDTEDAEDFTYNLKD
jgi:uncharacterized membrane protein